MHKSVAKTVLWSCVRPFQLLFFEQMCLNLCLLSAILLGILYLFFGVSESETLHVLVLAANPVARLSPSYSKTTITSMNGRPASPSSASLWGWSSASTVTQSGDATVGETGPMRRGQVLMQHRYQTRTQQWRQF
jgi:hypothetical protein